ncbi:MAG: TraR/DksA family transcriptional regulator [Pseudomonadota bacterium]
MAELDADLWRARLFQMRQALEAEEYLGQDGQKTVVLDQQSVGRLSRMDALQQQAMAKATSARRAGQLNRIAAALQRIEEGEFGYCADCGDEIGEARLAIDPTTPKCLDCARG